MLVNFSIFFTVLVLFAGLAIDVGMMQARKLQLQHAADAAALGAFYENARGNSGWVAAGQADAALNGFTDGSGGVTVTIVSPPTSGSYAGKSGAMQATVSQKYHSAFFSFLAGGASATPGASAVAANTATPDCIYLMGQGNSLFYPLTNTVYSGIYSSCNMYVNSTAQSINNNAGSTIHFSNNAVIKVQGTSDNALLLGPTAPTPTFGFSSENDPLSSESAPTWSTSCASALPTYVNLQSNYTVPAGTYCGGLSINSSSKITVNPGIYCGGLNINASTVTFNPGLYIITGGLTWKGGSTITNNTGTSPYGVMFYLTTGGGFSYGNLNIWSTTVTLSAPTASSGGALAGIVFFIDRNWANNGSQGIQILSSYVTTNGIWYALNTGIYNSGSTLRGTTYIGLVVDNISTKSATFSVPSPDYGSLSGGSPYQLSTVGSIVE